MKKNKLSRNPSIFAGLFLFFALAAILGNATNALAVQIKRVQSGIAGFDIDDIYVSVPLAYAVNTTKAIILISNTGDASSSNDQNWFFNSQFESNNSIGISRAGYTSGRTVPASVFWQVVEFVDGVNVQAGISSMAQAASAGAQSKQITINQSLTQANQSPITYPVKAVPIIQSIAPFTNASTTHQLAILPSCPLDTGNNQYDLLQLDRGDGYTSTKTVQLTWQIIEFLNDADVQTGTTTITTANTPVTVALEKAAPNGILFTYFTAGSGVNGTESKYMTSGVFSDASHVQFTCFNASSTNPVSVRFYVVNLTDPVSLVQSGSQTWAQTATGNYGINSITGTPPDTVTTSATHNFVSGDLINVGGVTTTGATIDNRNWVATTPLTGTTFTLSGSNCTVSAGAAGFAQKAQYTTLGTAINPTDAIVIGYAIPQDTLLSQNSTVTPYKIGYELFNNGTQVATVRSASENGISASQIVFQAVEFCPLTVKSPNGSEVWTVGSTPNITWKHSELLSSGGTGPSGHHKVNIDLSTNGGTSYPLNIATGVDGTLDTYAWKIPPAISTTNLIGTQLKVKITDTDLTVRNYNTSDNNFTIKGTLTLTAPVGGEVWIVGDTATNITWNNTGNLNGIIPGTLTIKLSVDGGGTYGITVATGVAAGTDTGLGGSNTYNWNPIPDQIGNNRRIQIVLDSDNTVSFSSPANFYIKGKLQITAPIGGETWPTLISQNITWNKWGTFSTLSLYYSTNAGGDNYANTIATGQPAGTTTGSYAWTVPVAGVGTQDRVKIISDQSADLQVSSTSPANFTIVNSVQVTSPTAGTEVWLVGDSHNITWTIGGSIANVKIEYSIDGGSTYTTIIASTTASNGSYAWTIPDAISNTCRVRISDVLNAGVNGVSANNFAIKGKIVVTSPNGGEVYPVGSSQVVTWQKYGTLGNVNILYSINGGTTYPYTIATVAASALNYTWNPIPDNISSTARVEVQLISDPAVYGASSANFAIKGSLTLTAPTGGQTFSVASTTNITWTKTGTIGNVQLLYSVDGGNTYPNTIAASLDPVLGTPYTWTVPDAIGTQVRVKVSLISDITVYGASSSNFSIKGSIALTSPAAGVKWGVGTVQTITWTVNGSSFGNVNLSYSTNGGTDGYPYSIATAVASSALSYSWTIPDAIGSQVGVKVVSVNDATSYSVSPTFSIIGRFAVSSPSGGEAWLVGDSHNITWTTYGTINKVNLSYSTNGGSTYPSTIVNAASNVNAWAWTVPDAIGTQTRVMVASYYDSTVYGTSAANFTIKGNVVVSAPNGGEVWRVGNTNNITWTAYGSIGNVDIYYSTDGGTTYPAGNKITPTGGVAATLGTYSWTIPDAIGTNLKVKVISLSDSTVFGQSAAVFNIKGTLTLTAPTGGQTFYVNNTTNITWTKTGTIGNVQLLYSVDGGNTYPNTIAASLDPVLGTPYTWTVPDAIGTNLKVQVSLISDPTNVLSVSTAPFTIKGQLIISAPNGAEVWIVASSQNITWTCKGTIANVSLNYSTDGGTTYPNVIIASTAGGVGSYPWTIPDAIGSTLRVKVTNAADATVYGTSAGNFAIKGNIVVTYPNGGQTLVVGTSYNVTWNTYGTISTVNLYYSTDGGTTYSGTMATATANTGTYTWIVPDIIGTQVRVKVANYNDATVYGVSGANITVNGSITITSPVGGETWIAGSIHNITWTETGSLGNVSIAYSTDGGATFPNTITAGTPANNQSYTWTVPNISTTNGKVKITSVTYTNVSSQSNAVFNIKPSLTVTAPVGGEVWVVASSHNITWTVAGTISTVTLQYSTDAFVDGLQTVTIATLVNATTGTPYAWTIPDAISSTVKVKVIDEADTTVFAVSPLSFGIVGSFTLTSPVGGEQWTVGTSHNITWTKSGSIANAKLDYSTDGGTTYPNSIIASTPAAGLSYAWTIPNSIGTTLRVKVSDASNATVFSTSGANFSIFGGLTVTSPVGGEVWVVASSHNITWTTAGTVANVALTYSTDGGVTYPNTIIATTPNNNSYSWTVPDNISNSVRVKVTDVLYSNAFGASPANFKIRGSLTITAPIGGEAWPINTVHSITWTKVGSISSVKLEYSTNGFVDETQTVVIAATLDATLGTPYSWTIPNAPSTTVKVRVTNIADATVYSVSPNYFSIKGSLTMTSPVGGEVWIVASSHNITWTTFGAIANVELIYSTDGGVTYPAGNVIVASTPASNGSYTWTIPDVIGTQNRVEVISTADATVFGASPANFTIRGSITITSPVGGETWYVGNTNNITWTKTGTFSNVKLEYSTNGFADETQTVLITGSTPASALTYAWTVPNAIGTNLKVRITNAADATTVSVSPGPFVIKGVLSLTSPVGGEVWIVGNTNNITWTTTGTIANVQLLYSTDGGTTYANTIVASVSNTNTYAWAIPNSIGTTLKAKVINTTDSTVFSASPANFTIKGSLTITAPNGGEVWAVASSHNITWTTTGTIANVKLEYSTDAFVDELQTVLIIASTSNTNTYAWTIPDAISSTVKVRITNTADATVLTKSNASFSIVGSFTLSSPVGGEQWTVGTSQTITWTKSGSIANAQLAYSTDGGTTYPNIIIASTPAGGLNYVWTIPNSVSTTCRVKISDASNAMVVSTSPANFAIRGGFSITAPNGGEVWIVGNTNNITWTTTGSVSNVTLAYSTDGGVTYPNTIVATTANTGTYAWTIPNIIVTTARVKVSDVNNSQAFATSVNNFKICGSLTITAPNGGEVWIVANTSNITWTTAGTIANVQLLYSTDGGTTYPNTIVATTANTGTYAWTIPNAIGTTLKVKVINTTDSTVYGVSAANFTIKGSLTITAPNGGEVWKVGSSQAITWSMTGSIANVSLAYSTDGGVTYPNTIVASTAASAGSYSWTIPDSITTTARVKITNTSDTTVSATSSANFKISGSLTLTAPTGGVSWLIGSTQNITWTKTGSIASVSLAYSTDGGATYPNVIVASVDATLGTPYAWTIPDGPSTTVRVKVTNTADTTVFSASNANFSIVGSFTLTAPTGGQVWIVGTSQNITWTKTGSISNASLTYSTDGGATYPNVIVASTPAANLTYAWTIPNAIGNQLRVMISDASNSTVYSTSTTNFTIKGSLTITAPNGGEVWVVANTNNITWTTTGTIPNVQLLYSTDGGTTYPNTIAASASNTGTYAWTIPNAIGTTLKVKVVNATDSTVYGASTANFTIKGSLTVTSPVGGEVWIVGNTNNITWTTTGTIANVQLLYSTDGGTTYANTIVATTANTGTYAWTIPNSIGTTLKAKVINTTDSTVFSASPANFTIKGSLTITAPNGGEVWVVANTNNITWTSTGTIANASLAYSTDGGVTYPNTITTSIPVNLGSYSWVIPDSISSTLKVKITNLSDSTVYGTSNANFSIVGSFTLTSPVGGEKWSIGSTQAITWTKTGSIVNAQLAYSTDGGATYPNVIIATTPAANLSYAWVIPNNASTTCRVKINDVSNSTVFSVSGANFKIMGSFTLSSPNGGEVWAVGSTHNITWTTNGSIANVSLAYSTDGGSTYPNVITSTTTNTGSYSWIIPNSIGTTLRVKITNVNDPDTTATSAGNFKICGVITMTSPVGGEAWIVASTQNITWTTTGSIGNVMIYYSTDGGATYPAGNLIASSVTASLGTFAWTIPNSISTTVKVRVTNTTDATVYGESPNNFIIRGGFTMVSPNGGEKWIVGTSYAITWTTFGTISNVRLDYSTDGGATYPNTIIASTPNSNSYNWTIPNNISATCRVRVSNAADSGSYNVSAGNFKIMGGFTMVSPNGGEVLVVGTSYNITWTTAGTVANAELQYSTDGGSTYPNVIALSVPNTNSYTWVVPDAISTTLRVKVSNASDADAYGTSAGNFKIRAGFTLTAPNGGEVWTVGTPYNITWSTFGTVPNVQLQYSTDGGTTYPNTIVGTTSNTGTYAWIVPDAITTTAKVKVSDTRDATAYVASSNNFKIQGSLTLTSPVGGEAWVVSSTHSITWNRTGSIAYVNLDFSTNGGTTYSPIAASVSNTGTYAWTIPNAISTTVRVRVSNSSDATVYNVSPANFKIQGGFTMTSPNGGETWQVGSSQNITWTTQGTVPNIVLNYSTDGGTTYPYVITTSVSNTGTYSWSPIPDSVSGTVRVKVSDPNDPTAYGVSAGNFRIRASFNLTSPNGGQVWKVSQVNNITWTETGTIANVKLQYSRDGFVGDIQTISASALNTGSYAWTIPDAISTTVKVRISDPNDAGAYATSQSNFSIMAYFALTAPNGGEKWYVGNTYNITWTWAGTVPTVELTYSTNGGATYPNIIAAATNNGTYSWLVPDTITAQFKVMVADLANQSTAYGISAANAEILPNFTVTSPNGGEVWTVNDVHNITWTNTGTVANVKLDYSTDGGTTYPNAIVASTANAGTYAWTIPNNISATVRVRVMSTIYSDAYGTSSGNFKIRGAFIMTAPNGGELWQINQTKNITWTTIGTIPTVNLYYSTDGGTTYPNTIVTSLANTNTYSWLIPNTPSATARVKIVNAADSTVFATSAANFRIQGFFTLTSPVGGEAWLAGTTQSINWTWGGTIPNVKITYSTDGGVTYPNTINAAAPNGAGGGGSYSYAWAIPLNFALCQTMRVQVGDPNDNTVYSTSGGNFKVMGAFTLTSPVGGERWITNETHNITWTVQGNIANAALAYSTDGGATYPNVIIASTPASALSYAWTVPDNRSTTDRVKISDASDSTVYSASPANFKIDYYNITWTLRDLLTNIQLTNLSVVEKVTGTTTIGWQQSALTSPLTHATPYGFWTTTWSCSGYGDMAQNYTANSDQSFTLYMETTAVHIWTSQAQFTYDATGDNLKATAWLERDGTIVSGASSVSIYIYDDKANLLNTLTSSTISSAGYFNLQWSAPTGLKPAVVYSALVDIINASGAHFKTPTTFSVTESQQLLNTQNAVQNMQNVTLPQFQTNVTNTINQGVSNMQTTVNQGIASQNAMIQQNMNTQTQMIAGPNTTAQQVINQGGMVGMVQTALTSFETQSNATLQTLQSGANQAVAAGQTLSANAQKYSWKASLAPNPALINDTITLSVQGPSVYTDPVKNTTQTPIPLVSIYNSDNTPIVQNASLINAGSGLYSYTFKADARFTPGKAYTYIVTEYWTGGLVTGSGVVESASLTTVQGLVSQTPLVKTAAEQTLDIVKSLQSVLGSGSTDGSNIFRLLSSLQNSVDKLPEELTKEGGTDLSKKVNEIAERLGKIAGGEGYDLNDMLEKAIGQSPTIKEIRSKADAIQSVIKVLQMLFEAKFGGLDTPVVSTSLTPGSVKFRIVALNPSIIKTQRVPVKIYLPQEVKPKDIMDAGGLELSYDAEKSLYYVYRDAVELGPKESRFFEVEVEDIWVMPQKELDAVRSQMFNLAAKFDKTSYSDQVKATANNVYKSLDEIAKQQVDDSMSREQHIGIYRQNVEIVKRFKEEIGRLEKLLQPEAGAPDMFAKSKFKVSLPSKATTWLVIFAVIIFLGLLAGVFFFVWQGQVRSSQDIIRAAKDSAFPEQKGPGQEGQNKPAT